MSEESVASDRVTVETAGLYPRRHRLLAGGTVVGEMAFGLGVSVPYTDAGGRRLRMARVSPWKAEYRLWAGEEERASARPRPLRNEIEVAFEGQLYFLRPNNLMGSAWALTGAVGGALLTVRRTRWDQAEIEVYARVDGDLLAFAYYLVVLRWSAARRRRF